MIDLQAWRKQKTLSIKKRDRISTQSWSNLRFYCKNPFSNNQFLSNAFKYGCSAETTDIPCCSVCATLNLRSWMILKNISFNTFGNVPPLKPATGWLNISLQKLPMVSVAETQNPSRCSTRRNVKDFSPVNASAMKVMLLFWIIAETLWYFDCILQQMTIAAGTMQVKTWRAGQVHYCGHSKTVNHAHVVMKSYSFFRKEIRTNIFNFASSIPYQNSFCSLLYGKYNMAFLSTRDTGIMILKNSSDVKAEMIREYSLVQESWVIY